MTYESLIIPYKEGLCVKNHHTKPCSFRLSFDTRGIKGIVFTVRMDVRVYMYGSVDKMRRVYVTRGKSMSALNKRLKVNEAEVSIYMFSF